MQDVLDTIHLLGSIKGYARMSIPSAVDAKIESLLEFLRRADDATFTSTIARMKERHGFILVHFAERMAAYAVRTGQARLIEDGRQALGIAWRLIYFKEVLPVVSLLYRSAEKLGLDVNTIFSEAVPGDEKFKGFVANFPRRDERNRSIQAMGYVEDEDDQGFRYRRTW